MLYWGSFMEVIIERRLSINVVSLFKYLVFFILFYLLSVASINGGIKPFMFGMLFALSFNNQKVLYLVPLYILAAYLSEFSLQAVAIAITTCVTLMFFSFLHKKFSIKASKLLIGIYAFLSQFYFMYSQGSTPQQFLQAVIVTLLGLLFLQACLHILQAILSRGVIYKLTIDEIICGAILLMAISLGITNLTVFNTELIRVFASFVILLATYMYSAPATILIANIIGIGTMFFSGDVTYLGAFSLFAVAAVAFKNTNRAMPIFAILFMDIILGLYFKIYIVYNLYSVAAVLLGGLLFYLINANKIEILASILGGNTNKTAIRNIVNRSREGLCKRMYEISGVFGEMDCVFKSMVRGVLPAEEAKEMLTQEIVDKVCGDCPERNKCLRVLGEETRSVFNDIISAGFERGKATILDVPPFLSTRCNRTNTMLASINQLILSYKQYATMVNNLDTSRVLIAEQLNGVGKIIRNLAEETKRNVTFDLNKETALIEELSYENIVCTEAVIYEQNAEISCITLVVRNKDAKNVMIEKVTSKVCGAKMVNVNIEPSTSAGFSVLTLKTAPKYNVVFGSAGATKDSNKVSGDTYSFIRIGDDKFLLAICDGMGSGQSAEQTSNLAISLIENFYKAGFDNDIILNSVNKLLSLGSEEVFTALDICVIDLRKSLADFIKVGAPEGFIKNKDSLEVVKTGSLPLGILEEMQPAITKKVLMGQDLIVMFSDGVIDSFMSREEFKNFVNNLNTLNPQTLAEEILDKALENYKDKPKDDCTVVVARVFPIV
jgi:stage II sporulation protein E